MYSYCSDTAFIKRAQGLTALDCAKAGEAVGAAIGRGRVGVACRNDEYSKACADAVCAGLRVSGVNAWSIGASFEAQLSFLVPFSSLNAGVFVCAGEGTVSIFGENGLSVSAALGRRAEDFMQAELSPAPSCGRLFDMSAISMLYRDELMRCVPYGVTDCAVLSSDSAVSALINDCMRTSSNGRALTLRINRRGTSLSAYTEETGVVPFVKLIALCGMYELESGRDISVPYDAPAFLDELARSYGRTAYRYLSAPSDGSDNVARRLAARQFWSRDALFTAAKLACILEEKNMTFPELYSLLPPFFVYSTTAALALPPDYLDEFEGESFSFGRDGANGFVLVEKRGKTHISPLGDGRVRLTAQSLDEETARELCAEAREFISSRPK